MTTLQPAGEAIEAAQVVVDRVALLAAENERKDKLLADTLQTLHNYCAAQYSLYGDFAPSILRESIAAITKEIGT